MLHTFLPQNCVHQAKSLLKGKLEGSAHFPYWHMRLMLQLAVSSTIKLGCHKMEPWIIFSSPPLPLFFLPPLFCFSSSSPSSTSSILPAFLFFLLHAPSPLLRAPSPPLHRMCMLVNEMRAQ